MSVLRLDPGVLVLGARALKNGQRLRIGIVIGARSVPRWTREFIDWLRGIPHFEVQLYSRIRDKQAAISSSWLFERLNGYSRGACDPFGETLVEPDYDVTEWSGSTGGGDVLIWLASGPLPLEVPTRLARFGVISVQLGISEHQPPYWDEVVQQQILSCSTLWWHTESFTSARPLRSAQLPTDPGLRFTRNAVQPLIAVAQMTASVCLDMLASESDWLHQARLIPEADFAPPRAGGPPSSLDAGLFVAGKLWRSARLRLERADRPRTWFVALRRTSPGGQRSAGFDPGGFRAIPLSPGVQMADPFLIDHQERTFLYYEEIPAGTTNGRLVCAEVLDDGGLGDPAVVLEVNGHLSYPCVFPHRGEFFMIPESAGARRIDLYRATRFPAEFHLETTLLGDVKAVDTTPVLVEGVWYFFTSTGEPFPQTLLFWSHRLDGDWHLHPRSPISTSVTNCRAAGAITMVGARLLRPTQDCSVGYGYAIVRNEIVRITPTEFEERRLDTILPGWTPGLLGTHTLNASSRFEVIDGIRYAS